ncbi:MAG: hypothetical protein JO151_20430 [Verrucomicrobia bacterium]|nr:hypothetical protein [Verrucomicrobiota bacterium]
MTQVFPLAYEAYSEWYLGEIAACQANTAEAIYRSLVNGFLTNPAFDLQPVLHGLQSLV